MGVATFAPPSVAVDHRDPRAVQSDAQPFPSNIRFMDEGVEPVARLLLKASPTFRRQCAIVATTPRLVVSIGRPPERLPLHLRAQTHLRRYTTGLVIAVVEFPDLASPAMLAHEFEHVIEFMERGRGVDVATYEPESDRARAAERAAERELARSDPLARAIGRALKLGRTSS